VLALAPPELLVADLATVELDLAAWERGFSAASPAGLRDFGATHAGGVMNDRDALRPAVVCRQLLAALAASDGPPPAA